ncbi:heparan-alpha-glucosaminide N-acetyltransferase domain-containing protein [Thalassotalea sp. SU-HH00458]|uniref:acyltransferase family protein n=1 Tax=Thalassotalea sp. SU-HH00458 TaxID=3127657 RepID=UPI0031089EA7
MQRYLALDALRGLTIALMILVNTPGSWEFVYAPLLHASWHGITPTDLVFPFFLFIVGSAMYFAFKKQDYILDIDAGIKIIKRGIIMFLIGLALNAYPFTSSIESLRIMGVLQRIGIAYIFAAFIVLTFKRQQMLVLSCLILVAYHFILTLAGDGAYRLEMNIVREFDLFILGAEHMYSGFGVAFDPEGLLSTLPSIVSVLFGFEVTRLISQCENKQQSLVKLLQLGVIAIGLGLMLDVFIPINKALWTSAYVIYTTGFACLVLALFVYLIDLKRIEKPMTPLFIYGTNPLFIYVLSWVWVASYGLFHVGEQGLHQYMFAGLASFLPEKLASFVFALSHVVLFGWMSKWLYERKIFIKI